MPNVSSPDHAVADVVVVGGRAAGAATAMLLARAGLSVVVLDRSPLGADTLSTHALMRGAVLQLSRWGLLDEVVAAGTPVIRQTVFRYVDRDVPITIKPSPGVDGLYAPRRTVLDPIVVRAAAAAGASVRHGVSVLGLCRDRRGRVSGVDARDGSGRRMTVDAPLVIGADGRRSIVARTVGAALTHAGSNASGVVYGYWSGLDTYGYEWAYRPGAAAGFIPTNAAQTCVFASCAPRHLGCGGLAALEAVVERASPDMAARLRTAVAPAGVRTFAGVPGYLRQGWGPGWALVGDAGSWKDPISAHGLTDAFRDAELLARAVIAWTSGQASESEAFAGYEADRDHLTLPILTAADELAGYEWDATRVVDVLASINAAMGDELAALTALRHARPSGASASHRCSRIPSPTHR